MLQARWALAALLFPAVTAVLAQSAPAKTDAESAAAMERAQRLANNPMRVILEAGKIRRRATAEAEPESADTNNLRRTAVRAESVPAAVRVPAVATSAVATNAVATVPAPATVTAPPPVATAPATTPPSASPIAVFLTTSSAPPSLAASMPALETSALATQVAPLPKTAPPLAALVATLTQPKLANMVEPTFAPRLADDVAQLGEVSADLALRADGSVAEVTLVTTVPVALRRPILAALERWRFEPLSGPRTHRVQLVFGGTTN